MVQRTPTELRRGRARQADQARQLVQHLPAERRQPRLRISCHADLDATLQHLAQTMHPLAEQPGAGRRDDGAASACSATPTRRATSPRSTSSARSSTTSTYGSEADGQFEDEYKGNCMTPATTPPTNGEGLALWDQTKYERLRGVDDGRERRGRLLHRPGEPRWRRRTCSTWTPGCTPATTRMRSRRRRNGLDTPMPQSLFDELDHHGGRRREQPLHRQLLPDLVERGRGRRRRRHEGVEGWCATGTASAAAASASSVEITGIPGELAHREGGRLHRSATQRRARHARRRLVRKRAFAAREARRATRRSSCTRSTASTSTRTPTASRARTGCEGVDARDELQADQRVQGGHRRADFDDHVYEFAHRDGNPNGWHQRRRRTG